MSHEIIALSKPPKKNGSTRDMIAYLRRYEPEPEAKMIYKLLNKEGHYTKSSGNGGHALIGLSEFYEGLRKWHELKDQDRYTKEYNWLLDCIRWMEVNKTVCIYVHFT